MRAALLMTLILLSTTATAGEVVQVPTVSDYVARIHNRITRFIVPARCESLGDTASGQVDIILLREGEVLSVIIRESSGSERCDEGLKRAVLTASSTRSPPAVAVTPDVKALLCALSKKRPPLLSEIATPKSPEPVPASALVKSNDDLLEMAREG